MKMDFDIIKGYLLLEGFKVKSNDLYDIYYSEDLDTTLYFSFNAKKLLEIHYYYNEDVNITKFKSLPFVLSKNKRDSEYLIKLHPPTKGSVYINNGLCYGSERSCLFPIKLNPKDFLNYLNLMI